MLKNLHARTTFIIRNMYTCVNALFSIKLQMPKDSTVMNFSKSLNDDSWNKITQHSFIFTYYPPTAATERSKCLWLAKLKSFRKILSYSGLQSHQHARRLLFEVWTCCCIDQRKHIRSQRANRITRTQEGSLTSLLKQLQQY